MQTICKKCGYEWDYKGSASRISCSKCKTSITIQQKPSQLLQGNDMIITPPSDLFIHKEKSTEFRIPLKLLDDLSFFRAKNWAKTNGETYMTLKADKEGVLSL